MRNTIKSLRGVRLWTTKQSHRHIILMAFFITMFSMQTSQADQSANGGLAGDYLTTFAASSRALGMGKAYNALSNDAAAPYWNPAGLSSIISDEVSFLYVRLFGESIFSYLGYVHPFSRTQAVGVGRVALDSGMGDKVTALNEPAGSFQDRQSAYFFSYSRKIVSDDKKGGLDLGASLKIVTQDFDNEYNLGYGIDAGSIFTPALGMSDKALFNGLRLGLALQNIIPPSLGKNNFPMNLRFGVAAEGLKKKLLYSIDINLVNFTGNAGKSAPVRWHTGLEYKLSKILALRGGMDYKELSFGVGFFSKNFQIDYGVAVHTLDITHRVGLTGRFGIPLTEEELRVQEERKKLERSKEAYASMMEALKFYREQNFAQAKTSLDKVLVIEPDNEQAKSLYAEVSVTLGKEESAGALSAARDAYDKMKYEDSLSKAKKVLDFDPDNKEAAIIYHLSQAQISIDDEKYDKAREELITVLKLDVTNQDAKIMLKRVEEALKFLK